MKTFYFFCAMALLSISNSFSQSGANVTCSWGVSGNCPITVTAYLSYQTSRGLVSGRPITKTITPGQTENFLNDFGRMRATLVNARFKMVCNGNTHYNLGNSSQQWENQSCNAGVALFWGKEPDVAFTYTAGEASPNGERLGKQNKQELNLNDHTKIENSLLANPTNGKFKVTLKNNSNIEIVNEKGYAVYSEKANSGVIELDLSKQPKGTYVVRIHSIEGNLLKKIVIQ